MNTTLQTSLLLLAAGTPLVAAFLLAVPIWRPTILRASVLAPLPALLLALVGPSGANVEIPWLALQTRLQLDHVGRVFLGFTSVLWLASGWYARSYLANDANQTRFHLFFLLAMAGNVGLILAADLPTFYAGFALMGLASSGLVFHRGDSESSRAGRMYLALAMVGEVLILAGLLFLATRGGTLLIHELHRGEPSAIASALLLVGFGIKAGALSLHFWLPLAHPAAPVPASAVLSGAMIKAGLLGWIRFLPLGEVAITEIGYTLILAGLGAALLGPVIGVVQENAKTVLAYSSISQMGIITVGVGIGAARPNAWPELLPAVLIYATHHALAKGALFLGVGPAGSAGTRLQRVAAAAGLVLPAVALAGAPFTSGALAKTALKSNLPILPEPWFGAVAFLLPIAAVGTTFLMVRFLWLTWPASSQRASKPSAALWAPWMSLVAATGVGVWLLPGALQWIPEKLSPNKIWLAVWPLLIGGSLAFLVSRLSTWLGGAKRWLPPGDIGVLLEHGLRRLKRLVPSRGKPHVSRENIEDEPVNATGGSALLARIGAQISAGETYLRSANTVGVALYILLGLLLGAIALSTN